MSSYELNAKNQFEHSSIEWTQPSVQLLAREPTHTHNHAVIRRSLTRRVCECV